MALDIVHKQQARWLWAHAEEAMFDIHRFPSYNHSMVDRQGRIVRLRRIYVRTTGYTFAGP